MGTGDGSLWVAGAGSRAAGKARFRPDYFGLAPQCGGMTEWKETSELDAGQLDLVADYVASMAETPDDMTPGRMARRPRGIKDHPGRQAFTRKNAPSATRSATRRSLAKKLQPAPDMFAWGSDRWTARMIRQPGHRVALRLPRGRTEDARLDGSQLTASDLDGGPVSQEIGSHARRSRK